MRTLPILLILLFPISLVAQKLFFEESFNDNERKWATANDSSHVLSIQDGVYTFDHKREKGYWCTWHSIFVEQKDPFRIETSIFHKEGPANKPFGLVWGAKNTKNMHCFLISNNFCNWVKVTGPSCCLMLWSISSRLAIGCWYLLASRLA